MDEGTGGTDPPGAGGGGGNADLIETRSGGGEGGLLLAPPPPPLGSTGSCWDLLVSPRENWGQEGLELLGGLGSHWE